jgi:sulfoxide reductase heme-binding subunit YedZ
MPRLTISAVGLAKLGLLALALVPFALLLHGAVNGGLGANPVETLTHSTGEWTLRFLLLTLAITPLRRLSGWTVLQRFRRMLGLLAFFYAGLHFAVWAVLDQSLSWSAILDDVVKRPYITVGFAAFLMLIPLALTSTRGMMRRLGRNWQRLHRLVYPIAVLGVLHFIWLVKADWREPAIYAGILAVLLLARLPGRLPSYGQRFRRRQTA